MCLFFEKINDLRSWLGTSSFPATSIISACNEDAQLPQMRNFIHPIDHKATRKVLRGDNVSQRAGAMAENAQAYFGLILFWDANSETIFMENHLKSWMHPFLGGEDDPIVIFLPLVEGNDVVWMTLRQEGYTHIQEIIGFMHTQIFCCAL